MDLNELSNLLKQLSENPESIKENLGTPIRMDENKTAKLIAAVVRNSMENFHVKYLSDKQMEELNPIIRNAIYTAIVKMRENPMSMYAYYQMYVPDYWEDCELLSI